jgi:hypothetical protein
VFQFFQAAVPVNIAGSSGITNNVLPAPAAGEYWVTNLAVDGSMVLVDTNSLIVTTPFTMTNSFDGVNLTLSWPLDHTGFRLQAQTNDLATGLGTNWVDVAGSTTTNQVVIPVNADNGSVFYRLIYP